MDAGKLREITDSIVKSHPELEEMIIEALLMIEEMQLEYIDVLTKYREVLREINRYKRGELLMKKALLTSSKN